MISSSSLDIQELLINSIVLIGSGNVATHLGLILKKRNYTLIKKANTLSISLFSNIKGGDYLFINDSYFSSLR